MKCMYFVLGWPMACALATAVLNPVASVPLTHNEDVHVHEW